MTDSFPPNDDLLHEETVDDSFPDPPSSESGSSTGDEPTRVSDSDAPLTPRGAAVPLGPSIEGYLLKEEIHRGGQGIVYRAIQLGTKRQVALKVLLEGPFATQTTRQRFEREIELAASLRHPNIVTILDSGLSLGRYYFAMEYIDGVRLDRYLAQKRLSLEDTLILFERVCTAVNFAHQRGVIHRDLKPANILVDDEGEPHILDFGLAKPVHRADPSQSTIQVLSTSGQLLGTVAYMSPEQAAGSQDVDVRSDVYSLGVILYDALVGEPPYSVDGPLGEVLSRIAHDEPANPRSLAGRTRSAPRLDDELSTILLKTLEKEPPRRYQTAGDLARDLRHHLEGEPIEAKRASGLYMLKKTLRRYRLQAVTAGLILLMLVGSLITFAVLFTRQREARQRADEQAEIARQAVESQEDALQEARERTAEALLAEHKLRRALVREHIQRGDLALERSDLIEARNCYWDALEVAPGPAAIWALRRYHLQTANSGAALLTLESHGPTKLSAQGRLAAVCPGPRSIWVRAVESGHVVRWVRTPGPITDLDVTDEGALAATGPGWACAWQPDELHPSVSIPIPEGARPHALYAVDRGRELLFVSRTTVRLVRGAVGEYDETVRLQAAPLGPTDFAPWSRRLAVPTASGVELISLTDDGLEHKVVWSDPEHPPRAVRFDADEALAVLADAVYLWQRPGQWTRFLDAPLPEPEPLSGSVANSAWELFDLKQAPGLGVFATQSGNICVVGRGDTQTTWRFSVDRLTEVRFSFEDQSVVTLDDRGTVTRWVPPQRIEQRRQVLRLPPKTWAASADGSTILLAVARGRVVAYLPGKTPKPGTVLRPRLLGGLGGLADNQLALAVNADGTRAVIRDGTDWRFHDFAERVARVRPWNNPKLTVLGKVALSSDGELSALLARSATGDQQQIAFRNWPAGPVDAPRDEHPAPIDFVGAEIRDMAFVPRTHTLLVVRSNGQLFLLNPEGLREEAGEPWLQLDSAPSACTFNRTGEYLAVACEDDVVRLISMVRHEVRHRISAADRVSALAFNPHDDVLLIRTRDGTVQLSDPATAETIAKWALPVEAENPLGVWIGEADALLLGYEGGVYEHRFDYANTLIERSRAHARQRRIARHLADRDVAAAWAAADELALLAPELEHWVRVNILEIALRRSHSDIPRAWVEVVLADAPASTYLQLGHAAYDGEEFEPAREWLRRGRELAGGEVDAFTLQRIAECDYLFEAYDVAAGELAEVLTRPELAPADAPTVALQRVAALVLAGRPAEARQAALRVGEADPWGRFGDLVAGSSARTIARIMTGLEDETVMSVAFSNIVPQLAPERRLHYLDDGQFFNGELARQRGDRAQAAVQYQRCIDLSRDTWPANWARYRLAQLVKE
ncbi:MAG: protein kinase [Phycisphaerae bacterium]|nr:protein kinase [Phycisphaerae bacterium]